MKRIGIPFAALCVGLLSNHFALAEVPSVEDLKRAASGRVIKGTTEKGSPWVITYKSDGTAEREVEFNGSGGGARIARTTGTWVAKDGGIVCTTMPQDSNLTLSAGGVSCARFEKDGNNLFLVDARGARVGEVLPVMK